MDDTGLHQHVVNAAPFTEIPDYQLESKPGQLSRDQLQQFYDEGFVIVRDFFEPSELQPCLHAVDELVDQLAVRLFQAEKINDLYADFGVFERLTQLDKAFPGANVLLFKQGKLPQAFTDVWQNDRLLNIVEQIVGRDVACHPVWNLRVKTPHNPLTDVPWHQDSAYFDADSYDHIIPTAWIPLLDVNSDNGTLQMIRRSHRSGRVAQHTCCVDDTWYVAIDEHHIETELGVSCQDDVVTCDIPFGGFVLFNNLTVHRSLRNKSDKVRWSIDLRWQSPHENWGFYGIAEGILLRSADQSRVLSDWNKFLSVNRKEVWQKRHFSKILETDEFDTIVTGPWIGRWPITHHNRHSDQFRHQAGQE